MSNCHKNNAVSGKRCIVDSCRISRRQNLSVKLFEFPYKDEVLLKKWLKACNVDMSILSDKRLYVCDKHFALEDRGKSRLKRNVIPTKYLKNNLDDQQQSTTIKTIIPITPIATVKPIIPMKTKLTIKNKYDKRKSGRHCVICRITRRSNPLIRLFTFPRDPERFQKWVKICQLKPSDLQVKRVIICEKHFIKSDLKGRRYTKNAQPRIFLSDIPKVTKNCIIKDCNVEYNSTVKLLTFPKEATNLFNIWSDIFHINKGDIFNIKLSKLSDDNLYICEKHFINYAKRPEIFTEINGTVNEGNSVNENNHDENEIELNNIKLEFVSATDPLENNCVIKQEHIFKINDQIQSETNESANYVENKPNLPKLIEKDTFYQKKIKKMRNRLIKDRKIYLRNIQKLKDEIRTLRNS